MEWMCMSLRSPQHQRLPTQQPTKRRSSIVGDMGHPNRVSRAFPFFVLCLTAVGGTPALPLEFWQKPNIVFRHGSPPDGRSYPNPHSPLETSKLVVSSDFQ